MTAMQAEKVAGQMTRNMHATMKATMVPSADGEVTLLFQSIKAHAIALPVWKDGAADYTAMVLKNAAILKAGVQAEIFSAHGKCPTLSMCRKIADRIDKENLHAMSGVTGVSKARNTWVKAAGVELHEIYKLAFKWAHITPFHSKFDEVQELKDAIKKVTKLLEEDLGEGLPRALPDLPPRLRDSAAFGIPPAKRARVEVFSDQESHDEVMDEAAHAIGEGALDEFWEGGEEEHMSDPDVELDEIDLISDDDSRQAQEVDTEGDDIDSEGVDAPSPDATTTKGRASIRAYVDEDTKLYDEQLPDDAQVLDDTKLQDDAQVLDDTKLHDDTQVLDDTKLHDDTQVLDDAKYIEVIESCPEAVAADSKAAGSGRLEDYLNNKIKCGGGVKFYQYL